MADERERSSAEPDTESKSLTTRRNFLKKGAIAGASAAAAYVAPSFSSVTARPAYAAVTSLTPPSLVIPDIPSLVAGAPTVQNGMTNSAGEVTFSDSAETEPAILEVLDPSGLPVPDVEVLFADGGTEFKAYLVNPPGNAFLPGLHVFPHNSKRTISLVTVGPVGAIVLYDLNTEIGLAAQRLLMSPFAIPLGNYRSEDIEALNNAVDLFGIGLTVFSAALAIIFPPFGLFTILGLIQTAVDIAIDLDAAHAGFFDQPSWDLYLLVFGGHTIPVFVPPGSLCSGNTEPPILIDFHPLSAEFAIYSVKVLDIDGILSVTGDVDGIELSGGPTNPIEGWRFSTGLGPLPSPGTNRVTFEATDLCGNSAIYGFDVANPV